MIVGKRETSSPISGGLLLGYDLGEFSYQSEKIGTEFKSYNKFSLNPAAGISYHFNPFALNFAYRYSYAWLSHEQTNEKNEPTHEEKLRSQTNEAEIMLATHLGVINKICAYGVLLSYYPYTDVKFNHLSSDRSWSRHYYGNAYSIAPYVAGRAPLIFWLKYKNSTYNKGFKTQEASLGFDFWVGIF